MKRRAFKLIVFLLAIGGGAIINVAVAWISVATVPALFPIKLGLSENEIDWVLSRRPSAVVITSSIDQEHFGLRVHGVHYTVQDLDNSAFLIVAGWPCHGLREEVWFDYFRGEIYVGEVLVYDGIKAPWRGKSDDIRHSLPLQPLWPGFAINTIFYAAILFALFATPGAVRRRLRTKRGQCAACGYSLWGRDTTSEKCPECGASK